MRIALLALILGLFSAHSNAQHSFATSSSRQATTHTISNLDRYGYDYYLPGYQFNGDSSILEALDLERLESFRQSDETVTVEDKITGLNVTLIATKLIGRRNDHLDLDD